MKFLDGTIGLEYVRTRIRYYFASIVVSATGADPVREMRARALGTSGKRNSLDRIVGGASALSLPGMLLLW